MHYLYGIKPGRPLSLVATFGSEQQLRAYVRWATLSETDGIYKFEQQSSLAGYQSWQQSEQPLSDDYPAGVDHNPSPSML